MTDYPEDFRPERDAYGRTWIAGTARTGWLGHWTEPTGPGKCETCGREAYPDNHPCSFERACSCWHGEPCELWAAGWNMPGYLPETDPETFATLADAVAYLRETMHRFADEDGVILETLETSGDILETDTNGADGWYESATTPSGLHFWAVPSPAPIAKGA